MSIAQGKFIAFEGVDAAGKTTNIKVLAEHLRERGYDVLMTREPGGTPLAEQLRDIILHESMDGVTELLLFLAGRRHHVQTVILPAVQAGKIVLCDRFYDSTYAYQGYGRGLLKEIEALEAFVKGGTIPHYTLFFDLPFEESMRRLALRTDKQDRLDKEEEAFRRRMYDGYQIRLDGRSDASHFDRTFVRKVVNIDALPEPDVVADTVKRWANTVFENLN